MLFNSIPFLLLVIPTLVVYYLPFMRRFQLHVIVVASFIFYAFNNPVLLTLLLASIAINIFTSYGVIYGPPPRRKLYATIGVVMNLGLLIFFKYSPLIGHTFFPKGSSVGEFLVQIPLPIGISFFTFQGISLLVDAYRGKALEDYAALSAGSLAKHALDVAAFKSFFPALVAGPVVKAHEFLPQIRVKTLAGIDRQAAFTALVVGYFLKMVVADNMKDHTFWLAYPYFMEYHSVTLIFLLLGYSVQIFADFAGYSLIAIGLAHLLGYRLPDNFNFPYISTTFSEFWRRWHISLSTFLRDYLYIPLGGSRKGQVNTYRNLMATMVLGGFWHGAAWSYAVWGFFHGLMLAAERLASDLGFAPGKRLPRWVHMLFIFACVTFAWLLFKLPDFIDAVYYLQAIGRNWTGYDINFLLAFFITLFSVPVVLYHAWYLWRRNGERPGMASVRPLLLGAMIFLIIVNSGSGASFIYFQF
ncbi:MAG TPA: MBOAT family O-acyltransferase [Flavobacteriales bacterium]|nr:hypothetical protein [Flavobacteriales bacterium]HRN36344.1 MBOAT family O-acyltransferase [Flavobacteriales bacterium]HRO39305.1 MBOAT family O-acyltransferase [Flavobacteriales bacterium]HRP81759.1 MBOAT family O-acyltransferase [Flavobacteriales bacterium]HRQ83907.1 MBOAT family O-acyltransferase [Flavobacteriales bacterium]